MIRLFLLLFIFLAPLNAKAAENYDVQGWGTLPVLHEGRVKPIDSFARVMLKTFSGRESTTQKTASEWLMMSLFNPAEATNLNVFKIFDADKYGLPHRKNKLYSYAEILNVMRTNDGVIQKLIEVPAEEWSVEQQSLMKLHENFILYSQILRSLTLVLPVDENQSVFLNPDLEKEVQQIVKRKGSNPERYTQIEHEKAALSFKFQTLKTTAQNNILFKIIPQNWAQENTNWITPWEAYEQEFEDTKNSKKSTEYIAFWQDMAFAYYASNPAKWSQSVDEAHYFLTQNHNLKPQLKVEKIYNILSLENLSLIFYILSFAALLVGYFRPPKLQKKLKDKLIENTSLYFLIAGFLTLLAHIILRVYILERAPVGTLYESILFVALICVTLGIFLHKKSKISFGLLLGSISGALLLITAKGFTGEDTMGTLVAVLNTNFWLATHVLCIVIGYGVCLITSLMAHFMLAQGAIGTRAIEKATTKEHHKYLKTLILFSLMFTAIGTILGGIWADQSWGRFWGWDPKENGALLIVLWLIWLLHAHYSGHLNRLTLCVGSAFLSVIVVLAWFGVNLLNVGLHSYGFISGVAWGIGIFCVVETIIIGGLWALNHKKKKAAQAR